METPNFTTPGHNIPTVYTVNQVLRSCATSKPCFLISNYKLLPNPSQFTFLLSLLPVLRIACLLWSHWASWRSYLCYFLPFYQLLSSLPPQPIFSSLHLAFTSSRLKLTPIKKNHSNFKTFALAHWNFIIIVLHCIPTSLLWQPVYKFYHSKISVFCLLL